MKFIALIVFSVIFFIVLVFSVLNFHPVQINFYVTTLEMPLALMLTLELLLGIMIGVLGMFIHIVKLKSQYSKLNKKLQNVEKQANFS